MKIRTYLISEAYNNEEGNNPDSIYIYIDVLRASTSVCAALYAGAKEVIPVESMDKAIHIHQNLGKETRVLAGERDGIKPLGFILGNSPDEFTQEIVKDKSIVLTTTNGSRSFLKGKNSKHRYVASFVNLSIVVSNILKTVADEKIELCNIVCAGNNGNFSFEDSICAGAIINKIKETDNETELNDASRASQDLYLAHNENLVNFIKTCEHPKKLIDLGFEKDIETAMTIDKYPVLPKIAGNSIKIAAVNLLDGEKNG